MRLFASTGISLWQPDINVFTLVGHDWTLQLLEVDEDGDRLLISPIELLFIGNVTSGL